MFRQNDAMFYPPFWIYERKWFFLLVKTFMPLDLDDRNDQITLSCSKIRYNEKKLTFLWLFNIYLAILKKWQTLAQNRHWDRKERKKYNRLCILEMIHQFFLSKFSRLNQFKIYVVSGRNGLIKYKELKYHINWNIYENNIKFILQISKIIIKSSNFNENFYLRWNQSFFYRILETLYHNLKFPVECSIK